MRSVHIFTLAACIATHGLAAETTDESPAPSRDYSNWYQVEVVIFANRARPDSDEIWPFAELVYPTDMLSIAPLNDEDRRPHSFELLDDLVAWESARPAAGTTTGTDSFLFEDRSRFSRDPLLRESAGGPGETSTDTPAVQPIQIDALFPDDLLQAFRMLAAGEHHLSRIVRSLNRSSRYRLMKHLAWRQPLSEVEYPVLIQAGDRYGDYFEVDGTITVSRSRYLHVDTNLWFTEFTPRYQGTAAAGPGPLPPNNLSEAVLNRFPELVAWARQRDTHLPLHTHELVQSRRMRSGEVHYIDHPWFGMIIRVDEFEYEPETPGGEQ